MLLFPAGTSIMGLASGAMNALSGLFGANKKNKLEQQQLAIQKQQIEADARAKREALLQQQKEFDWRRQTDQFDMGQKGQESAFKHANANARTPLARQVMAMLHKMGGYSNLPMMDKYAKGEAVLPPSVAPPVPGQAPQLPTTPAGVPTQRPMRGRPIPAGLMQPNAPNRPRYY